MQVQIDVPLAGLPADRKLTHVVAKKPEIGEWYLDCEGEWECSSIVFTTTRIVARFEPIETWRPVTIDDAIAALKGEQIAVRFRDRECDEWERGLLSGCQGIPSLYPWTIRHSGGSTEAFKFCEVSELK